MAANSKGMLPGVTLTQSQTLGFTYEPVSGCWHITQQGSAAPLCLLVLADCAWWEDFGTPNM